MNERLHNCHRGKDILEERCQQVQKNSSLDFFSHLHFNDADCGSLEEMISKTGVSAIWSLREG